LLGIGTPDAPGFDFPNTDTQYSRSAAQAYALDSKGSMFDSPIRSLESDPEWLDRAVSVRWRGAASSRAIFEVHLSEV
jgi:hypothetical protein